MEWHAVSRERAQKIVAEGMRCRLTGEGLRISAVSECLRAVSHLCSAPESGHWEPAASVRLTGMVRHRLASLWPDLTGDGEHGGPGVMDILNSLADLGDMIKLKGGKWLTAPAHAIGVNDGQAVLLGGGPMEVLPNSGSAKVLGRVRLVERAACEGWADVWEAGEWIGAPTEGLEVWSERLQREAVAKLTDAPDDMGEAFAYMRRKWVSLSDLTGDERGLLLCRAPISGVAGQMSSYFIGDFFRGRLRKLSGITSTNARRLRFHLDVKMGCPVRVVAVALQGVVMLRLRRRLPDREARVLLLGWQVPTPDGEHPGVTYHTFPMEVLPVLRRAFEGLGVVLDEHF